MQQEPLVDQGPPRLQRKANSVYARVMANEETRYAFFNTTQGLLYGNPDHEELKAVEKMLEDVGIAYLFNPDEYCRRPLFRSRGMTGVGLEEITWVASKLSRHGRLDT